MALYGDIKWNSSTYGVYRIKSISKKNSYGYVYNGYAVETEKLCPSGWRAETFNEHFRVKNTHIEG